MGRTRSRNCCCAARYTPAVSAFAFTGVTFLAVQISCYPVFMPQSLSTAASGTGIIVQCLSFQPPVQISGRQRLAAIAKGMSTSRRPSRKEAGGRSSSGSARSGVHLGAPSTRSLTSFPTGCIGGKRECGEGRFNTAVSSSARADGSQPICVIPLTRSLKMVADIDGTRPWNSVWLAKRSILW